MKSSAEEHYWSNLISRFSIDRFNNVAPSTNTKDAFSQSCFKQHVCVYSQTKRKNSITLSEQLFFILRPRIQPICFVLFQKVAHSVKWSVLRWRLVFCSSALNPFIIRSILDVHWYIEKIGVQMHCWSFVAIANWLALLVIADVSKPLSLPWLYSLCCSCAFTFLGVVTASKATVTTATGKSKWRSICLLF